MVILSHLPGLCPEDYHRIYLSLYTIDSLALPTDLLDLVLRNISIIILIKISLNSLYPMKCNENWTIIFSNKTQDLLELLSETKTGINANIINFCRSFLSLHITDIKITIFVLVPAGPMVKYNCLIYFFLFVGTFLCRQ